MHIRGLEKSNLTEMKRLYQIQQAAYLIEAGLLGLEAHDFFPLKETFSDFKNLIDEIFVCCEDDLIVGSIFLKKTESSILISKLIVDPSFLRRGIAKALVMHCLQLHPQQDFQVGTGADNHPALQLYQTLGFMIFATETVEPNLIFVKLRRLAD